MLHLRTSFLDFEAPARKRLLYRLWIAPKGSPAAPEVWQSHFGSVQPNSLRGGMLGQHYDERCRAFERRQAGAIGMIIEGLT